MKKPASTVPSSYSLAKTFQATWESAKKRSSFHSGPWGQ